MSIKPRLSKVACNFLKIGKTVIFTRKEYETGRQQVVALVKLADGAYPLTIMTGDGRAWDAHDIEKAKRSIKRHNKDMVFIDRRDFLIKYGVDNNAVSNA